MQRRIGRPRNDGKGARGGKDGKMLQEEPGNPDNLGNQSTGQSGGAKGGDELAGFEFYTPPRHQFPPKMVTITTKGMLNFSPDVGQPFTIKGGNERGSQGDNERGNEQNTSQGEQEEESGLVRLAYNAATNTIAVLASSEDEKGTLRIGHIGGSPRFSVGAKTFLDTYGIPIPAAAISFIPDIRQIDGRHVVFIHLNQPNK